MKKLNVVEDPTSYLWFGKYAIGFDGDLGGCIDEVVDLIVNNELWSLNNVIPTEYVEPNEELEMEADGWTFCTGWETSGCWLNFYYIQQIDEQELKRLEEAI